MITRIDTAGDPRIALYGLVGNPTALAREGLFVVEGRLVAPRLLASRHRVHSLLVSEPALASLGPSLATRPGIQVFVAPVEIISAAGGFNFHRGCLALAYRSEPRELPSLPDSGRRGPVVVLEGISNPDNVGGIFRSAHAFAAERVILGPGCGDPLYRKAIRTSMGAALDVPWADAGEWPGALRAISARGYRVVALTTDATAPALADALDECDRPVALLLGSEGHGLSPAALAAADTRARIPMPHPGADSLNVAAAASIALYALMNSR